jgi:hypothetical protein
VKSDSSVNAGKSRSRILAAERVASVEVNLSGLDVAASRSTILALVESTYPIRENASDSEV